MEKYIRKRIGRIIRLDVNDNNLIKTKLPKTIKSIDKIVDLGFENGKYLKQVDYTYYSPITYENLVAQLVAEKYSLTEENAIQRKAIMYGITDEFHIYNAYVEQCKLDAKAFIEERNKALVV